jgi:hypothetical protein
LLAAALSPLNLPDGLDNLHRDDVVEVVRQTLSLPLPLSTTLNRLDLNDGLKS